MATFRVHDSGKLMGLLRSDDRLRPVSHGLFPNFEMAVRVGARRAHICAGSSSLMKENPAMWSHHKRCLLQILTDPSSPLSLLSSREDVRELNKQGNSTLLFLAYFFFSLLVPWFKKIKACLTQLKYKFPLNQGSVLELMTNIITRFTAHTKNLPFWNSGRFVCHWIGSRLLHEIMNK